MHRGHCTREEQIALSLKGHLFPHGGREPKAFWICFSRVHPPSEIKSNFKFKTLKRHLLKRHLTLSDKCRLEGPEGIVFLQGRKNIININFSVGFPADIPDPYAGTPLGQKGSPHHRGRRKKKKTLFGADVHDFRFSARTSMTRRVLEKLCTKKFALIFWPPRGHCLFVLLVFFSPS